MEQRKISASIEDSNEIPTATPTLFRASPLSDIGVTGKLKMAIITENHMNVMTTISNSPLTPMSQSVHTSPVVLLDPGNVDVM